jgi:hypothetical protein
MRKMPAFFVMLFAIGCAHVPDITSDLNTRNYYLVLKRDYGIELERKELEFHAVRVKLVSPDAKFTQIVPQLPGEDMRKAYQPAKLQKGDLIIGLNGVVFWDSSEELLKAIADRYQRKQMVTMQVLDHIGDINNIVIGDGHSEKDFQVETAESNTHFNVLAEMLQIKNILPNSFGAKEGLKPGDFFVGRARFNSAVIRRSKLPFVSYSRHEFPVESAVLKDAADLGNWVARMHTKLKPYQLTSDGRDGVMGYATALELWTIQDRRLTRRIITRARYIGLGIQFGCDPYCGKAPPFVKAIFANSAGGRAGFQLEDLVLSVNGKKVHSSWQATQLIRKLNYGDKVVCRVLCGKEVVDISTEINWVFEY